MIVIHTHGLSADQRSRHAGRGRFDDEFSITIDILSITKILKELSGIICLLRSYWMLRRWPSRTVASYFSAWTGIRNILIDSFAQRVDFDGRKNLPNAGNPFFTILTNVVWRDSPATRCAMEWFIAFSTPIILD